MRAAGLDPLPHLPVRLLASARQLIGILRGLVREARINEVLLIARDYAQASGPFHCVADVLRTGALFALHCGVGPSIRALGARPTSVLNIIDDHGPQVVMRSLAEARVTQASEFAGLYFFCFGGYLRTSEWLQRVAETRFTLNDSGGFDC